MKNILLTVIFTIFYGFSFSQNKTIYILPLGEVKNEDISIVQKAITDFYGFNCIILKKEKLTNDLLSPSKTRYSANNILRKYDSNRNLLILTNVDVTTPKNGVNEWGVLGLGYCPGKTCVVSTFRMNKKNSKSLFIERLSKVSIHELGHNLGIPHCNKDSKCLMNDAKGTLKQIDSEKIYICNYCKNKININFFSKH